MSCACCIPTLRKQHTEKATFPLEWLHQQGHSHADRHSVHMEASVLYTAHQTDSNHFKLSIYLIFILYFYNSNKALRSWSSKAHHSSKLPASKLLSALHPAGSYLPSWYTAACHARAAATTFNAMLCSILGTLPEKGSRGRLVGLAETSFDWIHFMYTYILYLHYICIYIHTIYTYAHYVYSAYHKQK